MFIPVASLDDDSINIQTQLLPGDDIQVTRDSSIASSEHSAKVHASLSFKNEFHLRFH